MKLSTARKIVWGAPILSVAVLVIGMVVTQGEDHSVSRLILMLAVPPIFLVLLSVKLRWWRCPKCKSYLGRDDPIYCPKCGAGLRQTPLGGPMSDKDTMRPNEVAETAQEQTEKVKGQQND
jgi:hypothetical protein